MKHLIPQTIREFRYYERKLPLYLRNDDCFIEHFRLWYELLMGEGDDEQVIALNEFKGVSPTSDLLLHLLNIYDGDFLDSISQLKDYNDNCNLLEPLKNFIFAPSSEVMSEVVETPYSYHIIKILERFYDSEDEIGGLRRKQSFGNRRRIGHEERSERSCNESQEHLEIHALHYLRYPDVERLGILCVGIVVIIHFEKIIGFDIY